MATRYEISASKNGKTMFVAFTARKTRDCLVNNVGHYGSDIGSNIGADEDAICVKATREEVVMSDGTRIYFTGRTEIDVRRA